MPNYNFINGGNNPALDMALVTPNDGTDLPSSSGLARGVYVGTGGNVAMILNNSAPNAAPTVLKNVPSASMLPVCPRRIMATGTTASDMVVFY